jgi:serine/threonine-protein kinase HipA
MDCHVQIFLDGRWKTAAIFEPDGRKLDKGIAGGGRLQYDIDYAVTYLGNRAAELIPGLTVGFELFRFEHWPPFLVDLLPGGAGRRAWLKRMQAENDGPQMDWHLLTKGAGTPPGNLRIAEAVLTPPPDHFKFGFPRRDIIEQRERFLDYAEERGAHVAGASSVQGEAPKYLIVEDHAGMPCR